VNKSTPSNSTFSRRGFLGLTAAAASVPLLAACGGGSSTGGGSGAGGTVKFWDMPWGPAAYTEAAKKITESYVPEGGKAKATYQGIQWNNYYQTFSSAIASKTGPAVSTGAGFQAFQFEEQGQIAYADNVVEELKKNGMFEDFLPGVLEPFESDNGYIAIPWQLDPRVFWYRKSLFDQAGTELPKDWPTLLEAGKKLKAIGAFAFGTGAGAGNNIGTQSVVQMLLNNGGGLFTKDGQPDALNDRNVEAVEFIRELASNGIVDPAALSYNEDSLTTQWRDKKIAFGTHSPGLPQRAGDTTGDILVADPLTGPHGDKGTLTYGNNIMMYKNTPSQESSDAFVIYYLGQLKELWKQGVVGAMPVFKSITELPEFQKDANNVKIIKDWQPISKTFSAQGTRLFADLAAVEGGQALGQFTQAVLGGKTDAKTALRDLQTGIESVMK
jgi:multiple sugar transport system substrate-binding protein